MRPFTVLTSRVAVLPVNDIDTDQIIPARFLKTTEKTGLAEGLFADWRFQADGSPNPDFALNRPECHGVEVLLAGENFGCGSSREHAAWALTEAGFRAVISTSIADIFHNNALKNGLLPVVVEAKIHRKMVALFTATPEGTITIDLAEQAVFLPDGRRANFPIDNFSKTCLLRGVDQLGYLLSLEEKIAAYEARNDPDL